MTVEELRTLHQAMPPGSAIKLPQEVLGELIAKLGKPTAEEGKRRDYHIDEVAE